MSDLIKIKDVSGKYGISARTLRYYEDMGLLMSIRNDDHAYRLYDETALRRLEQILILRKLNISIKDIQRIFNTAGSEVVLEVLGKKVNAIDEEVALLHELKEIVLDVIRQIEHCDFDKQSDIKLLYQKAKALETQLSDASYDGNAADVHRLIEVTDKLSMTPEIIKKRPYFYLIFNLGKDVLEACALYHETFGAEIISEEHGSNGWVGVNIKIFELNIFVQSVERPGAGYHGCCIHFSEEEDLQKAYSLLCKSGTNDAFHLDWHWTRLAATVTDRFGVNWLLCI